METKIKYYLIQGLKSANPEKNLKSNYRIAAIPTDFPFRPSETAHDSLRHLRRYEEKWKNLKIKSSKIADKICDEKFVLDCCDFIITPMDEEFNKYSFDLLQHTIHGKYEKTFSGLHLLTKINKDIIQIEQTKQEDKNGIWEAKVLVHNKKRDETYEKVSTFFPKNWSPTHFMFEAYSAIKNLRITNDIKQYSSLTSSGIPVQIRIENNFAKTIFPVYQD